MMQILTLQDFGKLLDSLPVGQNAVLPCRVYETLCLPGELDEGSRSRAYKFARSHGHTINNQDCCATDSVIRAITNPLP